ncbi:long-chain-fatty-acid--CoA ligase [Mycolicibacterium sp.]|uniref:long-chain-fatty-acid--CoA ligase n=1 Tax=Mycolicibacterium sp. TaxID=2320850 RepID=UPI003D0C1D5B
MIATLADLVRGHARRRPTAAALIVDDRIVTFADLDDRSSRVAQAFAQAGVGRGDRVAIVDKNGAEFFEVVFGLAKLGAVAVPINWRLAAPEMRHIIEDCAAAAVVVGAEFFGTVETFADHVEGPVVAVGAHPRWPDLHDWAGAHPAVDPGVTTGPDDLTMLAYTSGTTGLPKGVMLSNANFACKSAGVAEPWRLGPDAVALAVMPMFHMAGAGWAFAALWQGATTVVLREVDPAAILAAVARYRVTNMLLVPAVIQSLLDAPGDADFASVRIVVYGASPISDDVLIRGIDRFGPVFAQVYGMTEATGSVTQLDGAEHVGGLLRSCGRPYPWVRIRVVDADGRDVPAGVVGEVWTSSAQNMLGYWNNPEATAAALTPDGWLRSGDAGYLDADGYLYLHDRLKDMIVTGGENVYPAEVENVLMAHPDVADVAVIGVPDPRWGEAVKAVVVPAPGARVREAELIGFARAQLAGFKLPKSVDVVAALPRTPSGKVLKRALREPYWSGTDRHIG